MSRALRLAPLLLAGLLAACASNGDRREAAVRTPGTALTPTEQYPLRAERRAFQILLAPHAAGLSDAQRSALADLADRWHDAGEGPIVIREPRNVRDPAAVAATGLAARAQLLALGVPPERIGREAYEPGDTVRPAVVVAFALVQAVTPRCGQAWENLSSNAQNRPMGNFGCAVNANLAAQIADPADIAGPAPSDPADAARRTTVIGKYRQGEQTGAADKSATITVSGVAGGGN